MAVMSIVKRRYERSISMMGSAISRIAWNVMRTEKRIDTYKNFPFLMGSFAWVSG
jgi:hypothetical protein